MANIKWIDNHIQVTPPRKPKKITGTNLPVVLGLQPYKSEFEAWCRCTRTYEEPFEGNKYTNAGEIIEPKVFDFLRVQMGFGNRVVTPTDLYGEDYFKKTWGDFFPNNPIFGGMDDALIYDANMEKFEYVVEVKTLQVDGRSGSFDDRWKDGEAPHYQALQASLYAYLRGIDKVLMIGVALEDGKGDYDHPEQVTPSYANGNVYIDEFKVSERYPNFDMYVEQATQWWRAYVLTGISPDFNEKKDAKILKELRTNSLNPDTDIKALLAEAEQLKDEIGKINETASEKEARLKELTEQIKQYAITQFRDGDIKVVLEGDKYTFVLTKSTSTDVNKDALKEDGLLERYTTTTTTNYRLTTSKIKED